MMASPLLVAWITIGSRSLILSFLLMPFKVIPMRFIPPRVHFPVYLVRLWPILALVRTRLSLLILRRLPLPLEMLQIGMVIYLAKSVPTTDSEFLPVFTSRETLARASTAQMLRLWLLQRGHNGDASDVFINDVITEF